MAQQRTAADVATVATAPDGRLSGDVVIGVVVAVTGFDEQAGQPLARGGGEPFGGPEHESVAFGIDVGTSVVAGAIPRHGAKGGDAGAVSASRAAASARPVTAVWGGCGQGIRHARAAGQIGALTDHGHGAGAAFDGGLGLLSDGPAGGGGVEVVGVGGQIKGIAQRDTLIGAHVGSGDDRVGRQAIVVVDQCQPFAGLQYRVGAGQSDADLGAADVCRPIGQRQHGGAGGGVAGQDEVVVLKIFRVLCRPAGRVDFEGVVG